SGPPATRGFLSRGTKLFRLLDGNDAIEAVELHSACGSRIPPLASVARGQKPLDQPLGPAPILELLPVEPTGWKGRPQIACVISGRYFISPDGVVRSTNRANLRFHVIPPRPGSWIFALLAAVGHPDLRQIDQFVWTGIEEALNTVQVDHD